MRALRRVLAHEFGDVAEVDEEIGDVDQARRRVRSEPGDLDAAALVGDGIDRVNEILVAGHEYCRIIASRERQHIDRYLDVEVRLPGPVVKGLELLLHDAKAVPAHPEQETLLAFGAGIDAGVEERAQKPAVAEKDAQQLVVIDIDVMKARGVEQIVAVNENGDTSAMPKLPRRAGSRIKLHCIFPLSDLTATGFPGRLPKNAERLVNG